jgi:hypothetical protein
MVGTISSIKIAPKEAKRNEILSIDLGKLSPKSQSAEPSPATARILNKMMTPALKECQSIDEFNHTIIEFVATYTAPSPWAWYAKKRE